MLRKGDLTQLSRCGVGAKTFNPDEQIAWMPSWDDAVITVLSHLASVILGVAICYFLQRWLSRNGTKASNVPAAQPSATTPLSSVSATELQELVERFNLASHTAGISVWEWDIQKRQVKTDPNMANDAIYGTLEQRNDPDHFMQKVLHPEDRAEFVSVLRPAMRDGTDVAHRYRVRRPDGGIAYIQLHGRVLRDAKGKPARLLGVTWDVTKEAIAAKEVERQTAQQRLLLERLNLAAKVGGFGVWDWDIRNDRIDMDASIARAYGMTELTVERNAREFFSRPVHESDRELFDAMLDHALQSEENLSLRYRIITLTGATLHVQVNGHIFRDASGSPYRMLGVTTNVTDEVRRTEMLQRQAEDERAVRDRLNLATQTAGIGVWDMDLATRRIVADDNVYALLDFHGHLDEKSILNLIHVDDRASVAEALDRAFRRNGRNQISSLRHRIVRNDGTQRHLQTHMRIFQEESRPTRILGVTWDVTAEVEHADRMQSLLDRFGVAIKSAGISPWEIDARTGKFVWAENRMTAFGLSELPLEEYGDACERLMHPDDRNEMAAIASRAMQSGEANYSHGYRLLRPDGLIRHMHAYAHIVRDQQGTAVRLLGATTDVTNEVQTNELLQRQAEQERALLDRLNIATQAAGISSWEIDITNRKFLWVESPLHGLHSVAGDTSLESFSERLHVDDRSLFTEQMQKAFKDHTDRVSYRYRAYTDTGDLVHVQVFARLVADESARITRLLGVSWDVTKEIEASEQLRDAERRLERASLVSSEGHWELDLRTGAQWMSSSYHTLLGYSAGELPQTYEQFRDFEHADDVLRSEALYERHIATGEPYDMEVRLRTAANGYRWFRRRGAVERDASGTPISMSGSIHDIHQQKLAEDALRLAQRRFERAIHGTQDGLWELEADGTAWCSPRIGELLGYAEEELASDANFMRQFLHPDDASTVAAATQAHFEQELPYDVEVRLRTRSGEYRWYRARASAERDLSGHPLRLSGSLQDVTDARAAREELMRATEAAEAANQAKSEFLANVSHEIRTPMNGIIGMTGLMLDTALDRTQRDYAETIRSSADSLLIVINDILDFSKIEAGKLDIEAIELDLRGNVEDVGTMMAFQAAAKNLELVVHVHPQLPDRVIGDPQRVRQCLINLVGNAIKFTRSGEIVIEVRTLGLRDGKADIQFEVRDTGIGIAPQTLQTLFQPFVQADSSTTRHFGGTGLGLSIVRRLVDMMGGQVGVRSEVGKGSTFWFTLPLTPVAAVAVETLDLSRVGRRVLVVDDNETNRRVIAGQLMHAGYEVSLASRAGEALQMLRQALGDNHPFEVVLADYQMADMDGAALGERINADPYLSRARVVILTSMDRHGDIRRFASLGFAGYLTKPVRARELFECMDRVLSRDSRDWHMQSQPIVTRGTLVNNEKGRRYSGHVLLVEDNPVNQKVAVRFLERMGCTVRVADNGAEGVKAYQQAQFDIVLMDLQMPVMDGFTATARIREIEAGGRATPIVALTANAMSGQLERCMAAGMNGFLTKPLEIARLHETLDRFGLGTAAAELAATAARTASVDAAALNVPIHLARLHELTDADVEFTHELAVTFIASGQQVLQEVKEALAAFDRNGLARAAHKLKGASANIHAEPLKELAQTLETQALALDQPRLKELVENMEQEFERAAAFLREQIPGPEAKTG
jgi:PAS domain S-box-containing protein